MRIIVIYPEIKVFVHSRVGRTKKFLLTFFNLKLLIERNLDLTAGLVNRWLLIKFICVADPCVARRDSADDGSAAGESAAAGF